MFRWLGQAGITTPGQLRQLGAVDAYLRICAAQGRRVNKMVLYALYGAINDENCLFISSDIKAILNDMLAEVQP